jgi:hypothetical protein
MQVFDEIKTADKAEVWLRTAPLTSAKIMELRPSAHKTGTLDPR